MILRSWRGSTTADDAERYVEYLRETGVSACRATPGNRGVYVLCRIRDGHHGERGRAEFLVLSLWDSMDAVRAFAGDDPERAVFYPDDDAFLVERDLHVDHYEVVVEEG